MTLSGTQRPSGDGIDAVLAARRMAARWDELDQVAGRTGALLAAEATALGIEALERVGVDATARTCGLAIYSRPAFEFLRGGGAAVTPASQWTDQTCASELSPAQVLSKLLASDHPPAGFRLSATHGGRAPGSPALGTYDAVYNPLHTVIEHPACVIDLALGAFARHDLPVASAVWRRGSDMRPVRFGNALRWVAEGEPTDPVVVLAPGSSVARPRGPVDVALRADLAEVASVVDALVDAIRVDAGSRCTEPTEDHR